MHLYNYIWVVLFVSRLNLVFLSPKLSRGIDEVLVYLYPCGFDNSRNTFRWKLLQLASVRLRIILFGLRTANTRSHRCHREPFLLRWQEACRNYVPLAVDLQTLDHIPFQYQLPCYPSVDIIVSIRLIGYCRLHLPVLVPQKVVQHKSFLSKVSRHLILRQHPSVLTATVGATCCTTTTSKS
jgi:hypothetical protein